MKKKLYIILLLCAFTITSSEKTPTSEPSHSNDFEKIAFEWTESLAKVLQLAHDKHYDSSNIQQAMIKAISTLLNYLDPHSDLLDPETYTSMLSSISGEFYGIGVVIDNTRKSKDKYLTIVDTIPDGPADKVGILPFDKIIEIEGKPLEGMTTEQATTLLKGERNTIAHIKILRENQQDVLSYNIVRDVVREQHSLSFYIKDQNIYYLSLTMFTETSVKQIENLLEKGQKNHYKGLILDLRNNSGGLLSATIDIAGLFLDKKSLIVVTKDKNGKEIERYTTTRDPINYGTTPIFILINNYTASAAEILAGCLKIHADKQNNNNGKHKKPYVFLVGTTTFGKGSVQEVIPINNNSAVKLTTSLYFLPNDTTIQGMGITPDFIIEKTYPPTEQMQWFSKFYGRESMLENYIKARSTKTDEKPKEETPQTKDNKDAKSSSNRWLDRARQMLQIDNQLKATISLINLLDTAQTMVPDAVNTQQKAITFLKNNYLTDVSLQIEEVQQ